MPKEYTSLWTLLMTPRCGQSLFFVRQKFLRGYHAISWKFHDVVWASGYTMNASLVCSIQFFSGWFESWWWVFLIKMGPEMNSSFLTWFPFEGKSCSIATAVESWTTIQLFVLRVGSNPDDGLFLFSCTKNDFISAYTFAMHRTKLVAWDNGCVQDIPSIDRFQGGFETGWWHFIFKCWPDMNSTSHTHSSCVLRNWLLATAIWYRTAIWGLALQLRPLPPRLPNTGE